MRKRYTIAQGHVLDVLLRIKPGIVQCAVTSPPYWGLRDYGTDPVAWPAVSYAPMAGLPEITVEAQEASLGQEETPEAYVGHMVGVFRAVRRVLRDDGTLWLNLGDSYANDGKWGGSSGGKHAAGLHGSSGVGRGKRTTGLKPKDLVGIPWRAAFALQADGWYLRADNIWHKPNPMPESVQDRCTKAHEYVFLLSKQPRYFYDHEAVKEEATGRPPGNKTHKGATAYREGMEEHRTKGGLTRVGAVKKRNKRDVWTIATCPFPDAHFAVFPPKLVETPILAGTSEVGACFTCRAPWRRVTKRGRRREEIEEGPLVSAERKDLHGPTYSRHRSRIEGGQSLAGPGTETVGWEPSCDCERPDPAVPCVVLDPFGGAGSTGLSALAHGRRFIGIELSAEYVQMARERLDSALSQGLPPKGDST